MDQCQAVVPVEECFIGLERNCILQNFDHFRCLALIKHLLKSLVKFLEVKTVKADPEKSSHCEDTGSTYLLLDFDEEFLSLLFFDERHIL